MRSYIHDFGTCVHVSVCFACDCIELVEGLRRDKQII